MIKFTNDDLKKLWKPDNDSSGEDNGQIVIIGGSELFTGAPLMSLIAASRIVDMVFLATPETDKNIPDKIAVFSKLRSFIWVPRDEIDKYIEKADAILIGPGMMIYSFESTNNQIPSSNNQSTYDTAGTETKRLTEYLLQKWPDKQWVIDGGSLQVMDKKYIPKNAILTPNQKEFEILFGTLPSDPSPNLGEGGVEYMAKMAKEYTCIVVHKGPVSYVTDGATTYEIDGGNAGLTKGGTGDVLAGVTVGLAAKNPPLLAAAAASYIVKKTAEYLYEQVGFNFNADDVANNVFKVMKSLTFTA